MSTGGGILILILSYENDMHAQHIMKRLDARSLPYVLFDLESYPASTRLSIGFKASGLTLQLTPHNSQSYVDLKEITSVWMRRLRPPKPSPDLSSIDAAFSKRESEHFLRALWYILEDRFWINPYQNDVAAHSKPYQLAIAQEVGLTVPATLISNDMTQVQEFYERCSGKMIYKSLVFHPFCMQNSVHTIYTSVVSEADLLEASRNISYAPHLFQEYVPKRSELRITIIGEYISAVEIDSQKTPSTVIDWRRYGGNTPHRVCELPLDIKQTLMAYMKKLGLLFGCIDLILTPEGQYVFLEINPAGQWYWLEEKLGIPLADEFTRLLTSPLIESRLM